MIKVCIIALCHFCGVIFTHKTTKSQNEPIFYQGERSIKSRVLHRLSVIGCHVGIYLDHVTYDLIVIACC